MESQVPGKEPRVFCHWAETLPQVSRVETGGNYQSGSVERRRVKHGYKKAVIRVKFIRVK